MIQTPAIRYRQGERDVYAFALSLPELNAILPSRSDDSLNTIQGVNRQLAPRHAANIQKYLKETGNWILGPLTLAIGPEAVSYEEGQLTVRPTADNPLQIIDGQHRRRAIANLLAEAEAAGHSQEWREQRLAVCLYVESSLSHKRQMFAWMAEQKPIDKTTRLAFDSTDPFNNTARWAVEELPLLHGRVHTDKSSTIGARDEFLLTIGDVKDIVTILTLSYGGKVTATLKRHHLQEPESAKMEQAVTDFWQLLTEARPEIAEIAGGNVPNGHLPIRRQDTWALDPNFLRLAAGCCHAWKQANADTARLANDVKEMDLLKGALHNGEMQELNLIDAQKGKVVARGHPEWKNAIQTVCQRANGTA